VSERTDIGDREREMCEIGCLRNDKPLSEASLYDCTVGSDIFLLLCGLRAREREGQTFSHTVPVITD
jgi:hypothetical protein